MHTGNNNSPLRGPGEFDALNAYLGQNNDGLTDSGHNLNQANAGRTLTDANDDQQLHVARLMNDLKNIRQTQ